MADETLTSLFDGFLSPSPDADFVMDSLWRTNREWVIQRLIDHHALKPMNLPQIFDHTMRQKWLDELAYLPNGLGLDLAAYAHSQNTLDLQQWSRRNAERGLEYAAPLLRFLMIKSQCELAFQRPAEGEEPVKQTTTLQVRTVAGLLQILEEILPKTPVAELIIVQRSCITAYPRLINYGEGFDEIIDKNGKDGNKLPQAANVKMEEHYKKMYSDEVQVKDIVAILHGYKHSRDPLDQDVFACMIHGLFDEYTHYVDYPLEALATTAVLFGGIISHRLISDLPLQIGLGMILEAIRDHTQEDSMYKFGLQALMQIFGRLREWPGFCKQLLQIPALQNTEAWRKAEEVVREHEEEMTHKRNGVGGTGHLGGDTVSNGNVEDGLGQEPRATPFASINLDPLPTNVSFEDPDVEAQDRIQFFLNNLTETTLTAMFRELQGLVEDRHQQWFASHLVEERAKMQPNYHQVYLALVDQFGAKSLWAEILRQTYNSVSRMLNSEVTMQNSTERNHLKNLGGWLGLLTLARDKPIKHRNIAFKQLLIEAHDTKRLIVVIPFVCKVLIQGASSNVFRPPNPWLMDIIHLLIELYHNAELKLNLKFEIEVLCKGLSLDHKSIQPSGEILNRPPADDLGDMALHDTLNSFETLSVNGIGPGIASGPSPETIPLPPIPDLSPNLSIPQTEVVPAARLHEIVHSALTRALQEIIQPVVDRSVTIAAISTREMIRKDFVTEPDEERVRTSAISMVKKTAGSLAQVTSKEPLRGTFTNSMRSFANELPQPLPEGIIIMCVNSNLELASSVIEKAAEERAVPEIEEMLRADLDARRQHRAMRPNEPYIDSAGLNRWSLTIPNPYKLSTSPNGLNPEQMAIYDEFAKQSRTAPAGPTSSHVPTGSNATNSIANEVLGDPYSSVSNLATPGEATALSSLPSQMPQFPLGHGGGAALTNGRQGSVNPVDARSMLERMNKLLENLAQSAKNAQEEHFRDLPRQHPVLDLIDAMTQLVIKTQQQQPDFPIYAAGVIANMLFNHQQDSLTLESLVQVLEHLRRMAGEAGSQHIRIVIQQHPGQALLHLPLISALLATDLLDWINIDNALAEVLQSRKEGSIEFLGQLMDLTLLSESPVALYTDFVRSLEEAWAWLLEEPGVPGAENFKSKILAPPSDALDNACPETAALIRQEQMDYVFEEWMHLRNNPNASANMLKIFVQQMHSRKVILGKDDFFVFMRQAFDRSVDRYEQNSMAGGSARTGYHAVDSLTKLVMLYLESHNDGQDGQSPRADFLDSVLGLAMLLLNHHHATRGENFAQRVFFRFFSVLLHEIDAVLEQLTRTDREQILLRFSACFRQLSPNVFPSFTFAWIELLGHRAFLPIMLGLPDKAGWPGYAKLVCQLLTLVGDVAKAVETAPVGKHIYHGALKLMGVLQHDFPNFVVAYHLQFCESLPPHTGQLLNMILVATPTFATKLPDPSESSSKTEKTDRNLDAREAATSTTDTASALIREIGLLDIVDQCLQQGPSEDAVAQITHAFSERDSRDSSFGHVPINVNRKAINAVVYYIGACAVARLAPKNDSLAIEPSFADVRTLHMLVSEVGPETRYYLLSAIVNQLRFSSPQTQYFSQVLLEIFGHDMSDPDGMDVRQQIVRILLERVVGFWPHPWGLMVTIIELLKNDKYMFFELPFIKTAPEVAERFAACLNNRN
ncbi:hypothetical protein P8C59_008722 [Phyllachora maydis]|uniref:General negative regulator of transcription subunit 1 n=1 Tax=Phyllachora maydis TaxID=1825666 RepID=A0AAD9MK74_9PEZI|nr:hypothetical protein P8C59_008722 [Phyllachora maydis]